MRKSMKLLMRFMIIAMLPAASGCDQDGKAVKAKASAGPVVFETQRESLEKAKHVDQMVLDAAAQQKKNIEADTQ